MVLCGVAFAVYGLDILPVKRNVPKELVTTYLGKASLFGVLVALVVAGAFIRTVPPHCRG
jgi:hypothetical protein